MNRFDKALKLKTNVNDDVNTIVNDNVSTSIIDTLKKPEKMKTQVTVTLNKNNWKKITTISKKTGRSRSYILDYLIENYLN